MRKTLSLLLCLLLIVSLSVSVFATEATPTNKGSISINVDANQGATGAEYAAYKLMDVTHDATKNIYNYTINETYKTILYNETKKETDVAVLDYLLKIKNDATAVRDFADNVYAAIKAASIGEDYTSKDNGFASVDPGYYLVVETKVGGENDTLSLAMLHTVLPGNATEINSKEDYPTVDKFVKEVNDSTTDEDTWGKSANYDIGDTIEFKLEGTVSDRYADYKDYYYAFHDTLDKTMTFTSPSNIKILLDETTDITDKFHISFDTDKNNNHTFVAKANLKEISGVTSASKIVLTYSAVLGKDAVIGEPGNKNKVYLVYQNDPYIASNGLLEPGTPPNPKEPTNPGKTPEKEVVVFTFKTIVNKTTPTGEALPGAGFTLYKWEQDASSVWEWKKVGDQIIVNVIGTDNKADFNFTGLDAGIYKLVETTVPAGYNKADDVLFAIVHEKKATDEKAKLYVYDVTLDANDNNKPVINRTSTSTKFEVTSSSGSISTNVINNFGQELPETGGVGTTILYIAGTILVLGAIVLLVTKKRMASAE